MLFYIGDEEIIQESEKETLASLSEAIGSVPARMLAEKNLFIWEYAALESEEEREMRLLNGSHFQQQSFQVEN